MTHPAANTAWARAFVDELARAGVREIVIAPGSRSTPLVLAAASDTRFRVRVHPDERSAAFFALGVGKARGRPAAVVTTSGTAAANLHPAVVEASAAEVPLLVLTADRPPRLRGADANQTIDQVRIFGGAVREFFEAPEPTLSGPSLRHLRVLACRAVAAAVGAPAGPVHVNFPFDKPLEPVDVPEDFVREHPLAASGRPDGAPFVRIATARARLADEEVEELVREIASGRGVIVAGPCADPKRVGPAVCALAAATGFPVLADPLSGARFGEAQGATRIAAYDLILRDAEARAALAPSVIVRVGASPTSAAVVEWLLHHNGTPHVVIDGGARWKDHAAVATRYVRADAEEALRALATRCTKSVAPEWEELWSRVETAALEALANARGDLLEADVWSTVPAALSASATLFVSNSTPVRDLDALVLPREEGLDVLASRGASGIDGVVSTAFGIASQRAGGTVCVIGDLAFLHDQNGLLWSREPDAPVVFVLVDNDGGGLFQALPIAAHEPHFTRFFVTPHGLDFTHAAALHGLTVSDVPILDLGDALERALGEGKTTILRVRSERVASQEKRDGLVKAVSDAVREALARGPNVPVETT